MKGNGNNGKGYLTRVAVRCQPDSRLVALAREGHDPAFEEIVRRYRAPLVSYAGGIVAEHRAEDVVQEALTKAHSAMVGSSAELSLKPWLYTIVRNRALNDVRDEPVHDRLDERFDGVPQPPEVAARREELAALVAGVQGLPTAQREALVKRELEGRSHEEIATSLGTSAGAVRGLIFRARTALRDAAGILIPMPALRALLGAGSQTTEATGAAVGGAAAGLAGGGGIALKAGATLGVAVLAVGGGIALKDHGSKPDPNRAVVASRDSGAGGPLAESERAGVRGRSGESQSGEDGGASGPADSSGPGPGSGSSRSGEGSSGDAGGSGGSSGPGPGGGGEASTSGHDGGDGGDGGGDDGGGGTSGSGDDGGDSSSSGSGSGDDGGGGSGTSGSGDGGGDSSGSGSGDGGDDTTTTVPSGSGEDDGGSLTDDGGDSGSGSSDDGGGTSGSG